MNINSLNIKGHLDGKGLNADKNGDGEKLNKFIRCTKITDLKRIDGLCPKRIYVFPSRKKAFQGT